MASALKKFKQLEKQNVEQSLAAAPAPKPQVGYYFNKRHRQVSFLQPYSVQYAAKKYI